MADELDQIDATVPPGRPWEQAGVLETEQRPASVEPGRPWERRGKLTKAAEAKKAEEDAFFQANKNNRQYSEEEEKFFETYAMPEDQKKSLLEATPAGSRSRLVKDSFSKLGVDLLDAQGKVPYVINIQPWMLDRVSRETGVSTAEANAILRGTAPIKAKAFQYQGDLNDLGVTDPAAFAAQSKEELGAWYQNKSQELDKKYNDLSAALHPSGEPGDWNLIGQFTRWGESFLPGAAEGQEQLEAISAQKDKLTGIMNGYILPKIVGSENDPIVAGMEMLRVTNADKYKALVNTLSAGNPIESWAKEQQLPEGESAVSLLYKQIFKPTEYAELTAKAVPGFDKNDPESVNNFIRTQSPEYLAGILGEELVANQLEFPAHTAKVKYHADESTKYIDGFFTASEQRKKELLRLNAERKTAVTPQRKQALDSMEQQINDRFGANEDVQRYLFHQQVADKEFNELMTYTQKYPHLDATLQNKAAIEQTYKSRDVVARNLVGAIPGTGGKWDVLGHFTKGVIGLGKETIKTLNTLSAGIGLKDPGSLYVENAKLDADWDTFSYVAGNVENNKTIIGYEDIPESLRKFAVDRGFDPEIFGSLGFGKPVTEFNYDSIVPTIGQVSGNVLGQALLMKGVGGALEASAGRLAQTQLVRSLQTNPLMRNPLTLTDKAKNIAGLFGSTYAVTYGSNYQQAKEAGLSDEDAHDYANMGSFGTSLTEMINPDTKYLNKIFGKAGKEEILGMSKILKNTTLSPTQRVLEFSKEYLKHTGSEVLEEYADVLKTHGLDAAYNINTTGQSLAEDTQNTIIQTAIGMIPMSILGATGHSNKLTREALWQVGMNPDAVRKFYTDKALDNIDNEGKFKEIQNKGVEALQIANTMNEIIRGTRTTTDDGRTLTPNERMALAEKEFNARKLDRDATLTNDPAKKEQLKNAAKEQRNFISAATADGVPAYIIDGQAVSKEKFIAFLNDPDYQNQKGGHSLEVYNDPDVEALADKTLEGVEKITPEKKVAIADNAAKQESLRNEIAGYEVKLQEPLDDFERQEILQQLEAAKKSLAATEQIGEGIKNAEAKTPAQQNINKLTPANIQLPEQIVPGEVQPDEISKPIELSLEPAPVPLKPGQPATGTVPADQGAKTVEQAAADQELETQALLHGQAEQNRQTGEYTTGGVTYKRNDPSPGVRGEKGQVRFAENVDVPFTYKLVEADRLQPSHQGGIRNPGHFIPEAQPKPRTDESSKNAELGFANNPRFGELGATANAYSGAPIVNQRDEVIQGNNRSAGLRIGYAQGNQQYINALADNAEQFGFTKEQVLAMKKPVLVREVATDTDQRAIELGNYDVKDLETGGKRRLDPVATGRRIPLKVKGQIAKILFDEGDQTLNQAIRANQQRLMDVLSPYINQAQRGTMMREGALTDAGVKDMEALVQHFLFDNGDVALAELFENLSHVQREGLRRSLPSILGTDAGKSILPEVQGAILALNDFHTSGISDMSLWRKQGDLFNDNKTPEDTYTPVELKIAEQLDQAKKQSEIRQVFAQYAQEASGTPADMFTPEIPGKSKAEAILATFNTPYNERTTTPPATATPGTGTTGETSPDTTQDAALASTAQNEPAATTGDQQQPQQPVITPATPDSEIRREELTQEKESVQQDIAELEKEKAAIENEIQEIKKDQERREELKQKAKAEAEKLDAEEKARLAQEKEVQDLLKDEQRREELKQKAKAEAEKLDAEEKARLAQELEKTEQEAVEEVAEAAVEELATGKQVAPSKKSSLFRRIVNRIKKAMLVLMASGTLWTGAGAVSFQNGNVDWSTNTLVERTASLLPQEQQEWAKRFLEKQGVYESEDAKVVVTDTLTTTQADITPKEGVVKPTLEILGTVPDSYHPTDSLIAYRSTWNNDDGFEYVAGPNRGQAENVPNIPGVIGVGHFLLDASLFGGGAYSHPYNAGFLKASRDNNHYIPAFTRLGGGRVLVKYKRPGEIDSTDIVVAPLRQFTMAQVDWNKSGTAVGFKSNVKEIKTTEGKGTYLIFKDRDGYSRFSGGSVVFIFEKGGNRVVIDFAGSVNMIQKEAARIQKDYGIAPQNLTLGYHDVGSFSAKPKAHNGTIYPSQYSGYNNDKNTGGSLLIPVPPVPEKSKAPLSAFAFPLLGLIRKRRENGESIGDKEIGQLEERLTQIDSEIKTAQDRIKGIDAELAALPAAATPVAQQQPAANPIVQPQTNQNATQQSQPLQNETVQTESGQPEYSGTAQGQQEAESPADTSDSDAGGVRQETQEVGQNPAAFKPGDRVRSIYSGKEYTVVVADKRGMAQLRNEYGGVEDWNAHNNAHFQLVTGPAPTLSLEQLEQIPYDSRTDKQHADFIRQKFAQVFAEKGVPQEQIDAAIALMDARAKVLNPENPDEWYNGIEDIGRGEIDQKVSPTAKGALETLENGRKVIHALNGPNFSTTVHEIAHIFETELTSAEKKIIQDWSGQNRWNKRASEAFARGFERYLRDGVAPTAELKTIFDKAKEWLQSIYQQLSGSPIARDIDPEVKRVFDSLFTTPQRQQQRPAPAVTPAANKAPQAAALPAMNDLLAKARAKLQGPTNDQGVLFQEDETSQQVNAIIPEIKGMAGVLQSQGVPAAEIPAQIAGMLSQDIPGVTAQDIQTALDTPEPSEEGNMARGMKVDRSFSLPSIFGVKPVVYNRGIDTIADRLDRGMNFVDALNAGAREIRLISGPGFKVAAFRKAVSDVMMGQKPSISTQIGADEQQSMELEASIEREYESRMARGEREQSGEEIPAGRTGAAQAELNEGREGIGLAPATRNAVQSMDELNGESMQRVADDTINVHRTISQIENDDDYAIGKREQHALTRYITNLNNLINNQGDAMVKAYRTGNTVEANRLAAVMDANTKLFDQATRALYKARSMAGSVLGYGSQTSTWNAMEDLGNLFARVQREANGGDALTREQQERITKEWEAIKTANEAYTQKIQELQDENSRLQAELQLERVQKEKERDEKSGKTTTRDAYKKSYNDARKSIRDMLRRSQGNKPPDVQFQDEGSPQNSEDVKLFIDHVDLADMAGPIRDMFRALVKGEGISDVNAAVQTILTDLKQDGITNLTERNIRDMISGYGLQREAQTRSQVEQQIREMRKEMELISELEDLQNGLESQRPGRAKRKQSERIKELKRLIRVAAGEKGFGRNLPQSTTTALDALKGRYAAGIKRLQTRVAEGDYAVSKAPEIELDEEGKMLRRAYNEAKKNFENNKERDRLKNLGGWQKAKYRYDQVTGTIWNLKTTLDMSALLRQGLQLGISNPKAWAEMWGKSFEFFGSEKKYKKWQDDLMNSDFFIEVMQPAGLFIGDQDNPTLSAREEQYTANLIKKWPVFGFLMKASERSYTGGLNVLRANVFAQGAELLKMDGATMQNSPERYKSLANYINHATGRGDLSALGMERAAGFLNKTFFSPRFMASRINTINPAYWYKLDKQERITQVKDFAKFMLFNAAIMGLGAAAGGDIDDDPTEADFAKLRFGETRVDFWGGYLPYVNLISRSLTGRRGTKEFKGKDYQNMLVKFTQGKLAPVPGAAISWYFGYNAVNEPVNVRTAEGLKNLGSQLGTPMSIETAIETLISQDPAKGLFLSGLSFFGGGVNTYTNYHAVSPVIPEDDTQTK